MGEDSEFSFCCSEYSYSLTLGFSPLEWKSQQDSLFSRQSEGKFLFLRGYSGGAAWLANSWYDSGGVWLHCIVWWLLPHGHQHPEMSACDWHYTLPARNL